MIKWTSAQTIFETKTIEAKVLACNVYSFTALQAYQKVPRLISQFISF